MRMRSGIDVMEPELMTSPLTTEHVQKACVVHSIGPMTMMINANTYLLIQVTVISYVYMYV